MLAFNPFEVYAGYLKKLGEKDSFYHYYAHQLKMAGDIASSFPAAYTGYHQKSDFSIPKNRLSRLYL